MDAAARAIQTKFGAARAVLDALAKDGACPEAAKADAKTAAAAPLAADIKTAPSDAKKGATSASDAKKGATSPSDAKKGATSVSDAKKGATSVSDAKKGATSAVLAVKIAKIAESLLATLAAIEMRHVLSTGHLHLMAAVKGAGSAGEAAARDDYMRAIANENVAEKIDTLMASIAGVTPTTDRARQLLAAYAGQASATSQPDTRVAFESCGCAGADLMAVDGDRSELCCQACGAVRALEGTVFEDSDRYGQEGQKTKSGTFNPNRHFQYWWLRIYAREPIGDLSEDDPSGEKVLRKLREAAQRKKLTLRLLTVTDVRDLLRTIGRTNLNKNTALIMKKLTGVGPPDVPDSLARRIEKYFTKAIEISERKRRDGRVNRNYYPFYIYKIVDALVADPEQRRVLYYIYLQSSDTVVNDDRDWEAICEDPGMKEITYRPTDRLDALKYQPK